MSKYTKSLDSNHTEIVRDLRRVGVWVADLAGNGGGCPDILTHANGQVVFIELKYSDKAELKKSQLEFFANSPVWCGVATNFNEALRLAKTPSQYALSGRQINKLRQFLATWQGKRLHLPTFYEVIG